jgi:hypothetical protein
MFGMSILEKIRLILRVSTSQSDPNGIARLLISADFYIFGSGPCRTLPLFRLNLLVGFC